MRKIKQLWVLETAQHGLEMIDSSLRTVQKRARNLVGDWTMRKFVPVVDEINGREKRELEKRRRARPLDGELLYQVLILDQEGGHKAVDWKVLASSWRDYYTNLAVALQVGSSHHRVDRPESVETKKRKNK